MYRRIMVPVDGSRTSMLGLNEAIRLAKHYKARVRLIHVVDAFIVTPGFAAGRYIADIQKALREDAGRILKEGRALLRKHGLTADSEMLEIIGGRAADAIVTHARKWRADLIVIGTHGRRGVSRLVMGSDAEQVARTAATPVLLVRTKLAGQ